MIYFDTSYLVRIYIQDPGWEKVRVLTEKQQVGCSNLGKAELIGAFHRKFREKRINRIELQTLMEEFETDCLGGAFTWFPVTESVLERVRSVYGKLSQEIALRSADAVHLATASENNFAEIYTNDKLMLLSAQEFGIKGMNIL